MTKFDFDLFVIGAGSGGVRAARIAAAHGARVAIAEEYRFGGTCVIRGCVPKKLLVYASRFADDFSDARGFGWTLGDPDFDWPSLVAAKDKEITRLEGLYRGTLARAGVSIFEERAVLTGPNSVRLGTSGKSVTAAKILIATGAKPNLDAHLPGIEHVDVYKRQHHHHGQYRPAQWRGTGRASVSGNRCRVDVLRGRSDLHLRCVQAFKARSSRKFESQTER